MTMADVEAALPWGLHDALLESIQIDWLNARASLMCAMIAERQDLDRRGKVTVSGLVFCSIDSAGDRSRASLRARSAQWLAD